jgi:hypothetical protein
MLPTIISAGAVSTIFTILIFSKAHDFLMYINDKNDKNSFVMISLRHGPVLQAMVQI